MKIKLHTYYVLKKDSANRVLTDGKNELMLHIKQKLVHLLKGKGPDTTIKAGTIVQVIEIDSERKNMCTLYVPSIHACYLDYCTDDRYDALTAYPFMNKLWTSINET